MFLPEWWHWIVLGLGLAITEMAVPAFFVIWFGIAAVGVGVLLLLIPDLAFSTQIMSWTGLSMLLISVWFRFLKPKTMSSVGTSSGMIVGEVGVLASDLASMGRGQVRFQKPLLGAERWDCYAEHELKAGERVRVVSVEGSFVKVEAAK